MRTRRSLGQAAPGTVHGDLTVTGLGERRGGANNDAWFPCRCICGKKQLWVRFRSLTPKSSCGHRRNTPKHGGTVGGRKIRLYRIWQHMVSRCYDPGVKEYPNYGGRGILMAKEWWEFEPFRDWALANGYQDDLWIDRRDNDDHYVPENCHWVTPAENLRNKRTNRWLEAFGERKIMIDWSEDSRCVVSYKTLTGRIRAGWDHEAALTTPLGLLQGKRRD